jgi:ribonucleoside-diphosphate reductase alpha chain
LLPEQGKVMLTKKGFYKKEWENSPQEGYARCATSYCFGDYDFAQRMYNYMSNLWFTPASPVLSNAQEVVWPTDFRNFEEAGDWLEENLDPDGMPISCFLSLIPDTKEGLVSTSSETRSISMNGGGIGIMPSMRSPDEKSTGVMAHMRTYDADALAYKQTESRRGSIAAYMNIDHPEIMSFMAMRDPVGGDINKKCFNLNNGVNLTDEFMFAMIQNKDYELVDPKHGKTGRFLNAREVWDKLMDLRYETGEPYIMFKDTVNRNIPDWITRPFYNVVQSNLCSEITLLTSLKRTAVCCLSSLNMERYDEWKDTQLVEDVVRFLDNVLEYFIRLAPLELSRAVYSARKERALGMGTLGWHSYLQSKMIPFESGGFNSNIQLTNVIYKSIKEKAVAQSRILATERGEPSDCRNSGMRNSHLMALAPNASTGSLVGASPSREPWSANVFVSKGRAGLFLIKNKYLKELLAKYDKDTEEVWLDINDNEGSVQHLDFLPDHEKNVFKTAHEIDQTWIIEAAAASQPYICQSQSTNIFIRKGTTKQYMSDLHVLAWTKGVKTLYYCRAEKAVNAKVKNTDVSQPLNKVEVDISFSVSDCLSCDG